jgi:hypothetical protein
MKIARAPFLSILAALAACAGPSPAPEATVSGAFEVADSALLDVSLPIAPESSLHDGLVLGTCVISDAAGGRSLSVHLENAADTGSADAIMDADVVVAAGASTAAVTTTLWVSDTAATFSAAACPVTFSSTAGSSDAVVAGTGPCTLSTTTAGGIDVSATFNLMLHRCDVR